MLIVLRWITNNSQMYSVTYEQFLNIFVYRILETKWCIAHPTWPVDKKSPKIIHITPTYLLYIGNYVFLYNWLCLAAIYHCCTEAGTSTPSAMELGANDYVDKSLTTPLTIKGESLSSVRVSVLLNYLTHLALIQSSAWISKFFKSRSFTLNC